MAAPKGAGLAMELVVPPNRSSYTFLAALGLDADAAELKTARAIFPAPGEALSQHSEST